MTSWCRPFDPPVAGWGPVFTPDRPVHEADVVQLGCVINVIEDVRERTDTLERAWQLCRNLLVVAARAQTDDCRRVVGGVPAVHNAAGPAP